MLKLGLQEEEVIRNELEIQVFGEGAIGGAVDLVAFRDNTDAKIKELDDGAGGAEGSHWIHGNCEGD